MCQLTWYYFAGCKHISLASTNHCSEARRGIPWLKRIECDAMEFKADPTPLESSYYNRESDTIKKNGICGKCSVNLKAEMEAVFWKWQVKALEEDMRALEESNNEST